MMSITKIYYSLFLSCLLSKSYAQTNQLESSIYTIGTNSVLSGIGAVINKKDDAPLGKTFVKGLYKGALGGTVMYASKNLTNLITQKNELGYSWLSKLTNSVGFSMVENAATNRGLFEQLNLHIGFNRLEFHTKEKLKVRYKVMPASLIITSYVAINNKFEPLKTLQTGELIFSTNNLKGINLEQESLGYNLGNVTVINSKAIENINVYNHEFIHIYQLNDYNALNTFTNRWLEKMATKSKFFSFYNRYFYSDFLGTGSIFALYQMANQQGHANNYFEDEARLYSKQK